MFCAGYNLYFFRYAFPLNSNDFSDETFFLQLHLLLVFPSFWIFYHLIFHDISLKSQESFVYFPLHFTWYSVDFILFQPFFVELFFEPSNYIRLFIRYYSLFIRYFIGSFIICSLSFELFSCLYLLFRVLCFC